MRGSRTIAFALLVALASCGQGEPTTTGQPDGLARTDTTETTAITATTATTIEAVPGEPTTADQVASSADAATETTAAPGSDEPALAEKPFCSYLREIDRLDERIRTSADDPMAWNRFLTESNTIREDMADSLGGADPYYQALTASEFYERLVEAWDFGLSAEEFNPSEAELALLRIGQEEERVLEARAEQFCGFTLEPIEIPAGLSL